VSNDLLRPQDHTEAVALFRAEVIGALARRELSRGGLAAECAAEAPLGDPGVGFLKGRAG
jgi:hypothetical protein